MAAEESQALVRFIPGWVEAGTSEDGMPRFTETIRIIKSIPPFTEVQREATDIDIAENPGPYQLYLRENEARLQQPKTEGFPLALWPVVSPAHFKMLVARDITTIEQLAAKAGRDPSMPGEIKELADRAKQMIALSANIGKFEAMVRDLEGQRAALLEQNRELAATISAQNSLINTLKMTAAPVQGVA